jgi:hypothetical protein
MLLCVLDDSSPSGWLTPTLVFQPWYSYAIARYLLSQHIIQPHTVGPVKKGFNPLLIFEVGGGNGTNARHILDWLRTNSPSIYAQCHYTLLEFSPRLREAQAAAVATHGPRATVAAADATNVLEANFSGDSRPCFVIGLEVLDNLPHDKAVCINGIWHQTGVTELPHFGETYTLITDPLIQDLLEIAKSLGLPSVQGALPLLPPVRGRLFQGAQYLLTGNMAEWAVLPRAPAGAQHAMYLPTGALQMLRGLHALLPQHRLLLADFDGLPAPDVNARTLQADNRVHTYCPAHNSPITASKDPVKCEYGHSLPSSSKLAYPHSCCLPLMQAKPSTT